MERDSVRPLLQVRDLKVYFPIVSPLLRRQTGAIRAVDGVTFTLEPGDCLGLVGESGSGKSTTGRAIARLTDVSSGSIDFDGRAIEHLRGADLREFRKRVQMVFQDPFSSLNPRMTAGRIVREPLTIHRTVPEAKRDERVRELFHAVGLDPSHLGRYPHQFSGGQRQRIGIARALAVAPDLIVCDEPVSALDVSIQAQILNLLGDLRERLRLTYVFISHDLAVVRHISDRVAVMYLGRLVESGPTEEVFDVPRHPYTVALLSSVPKRRKRMSSSAEGEIILRGEIPSAANPPSGCRFHTRCWLYEQLGKPSICRTDDPVLLPSGNSHFAACHFAPTAQKREMGVKVAVRESNPPSAPR